MTGTVLPLFRDKYPSLVEDAKRMTQLVIYLWDKMNAHKSYQLYFTLTDTTYTKSARLTLRCPDLMNNRTIEECHHVKVGIKASLPAWTILKHLIHHMNRNEVEEYLDWIFSKTIMDKAKYALTAYRIRVAKKVWDVYNEIP